MLHRSKSLWQGIRRHGPGWEAEVRIKGHVRLTMQFPIDADPRDMQRWRQKEKKRLQLTTRATSGTFAGDALKYLKARRAMPGIKERTRHINLWVAEFGTMARSKIRPYMIAEVRDRWLLEGPKRVFRKWTDDGIDRRGGRLVDVKMPLSASQVCKRLRALQNLWTVLDGRREYNPVRDVEEPKEPKGEPRGLPYDVVEAILERMPDTGRATKGQTRAGLPGLTKLRLRVIAYTGLSHSELAGIRAAHLHLDDARPWVWVQGRDKGEGTDDTAQPLTHQGADALRALAAAGGLGKFSKGSMWRSFQRACKRLGLSEITPYDLRHSFASEVFEKTGNLDVTQLLMRHRSRVTTLRYGRKAIDPVRAAAIDQLRASGSFAAFRAALPADTIRNSETFSDNTAAASGAETGESAGQKPQEQA